MVAMVSVRIPTTAVPTSTPLALVSTVFPAARAEAPVSASRERNWFIARVLPLYTSDKNGQAGVPG